MGAIESTDEPEYLVLLNDEEQYSIWPADRPLPSGWREAGRRGDRQACLAFITATWIDMRPKSLRDRDRLTAQ
jgi:MbtH protein